MARIEELKDVPKGKVQQIIDSYRSDGATEVKKTLQPNGKFTITATFPDSPEE